MREKVLLSFYYRLRHAQDGIEALAHVLDQPLGFLQLGTHGALTLALLQQVGVHGVDAQARHDVVVQRHLPAIARALDNHVGHHVIGHVGGEHGARVRVAQADYRLRLAQVFIIAIEGFFQLVEIALGKPGQVLFHDDEGHAPRHQGDVRQALDLQRQAFGRIARAHAGRIETLQQGQGRAQLVGVDFQLFRQARQDVVERLFQVAIIVEGVNDQLDQRAVAQFEHRHAHLLHQVLAQGAVVGFKLWAGIFVVGRLAAARLAPVAVAAVRGGRAVARLAVKAVRFGRRGGHLLARRLGRRFGRRGRGTQGAVGQQAQRTVERVVEAFEQRIVRQQLLQFLMQFQGR